MRPRPPPVRATPPPAPSPAFADPALASAREALHAEGVGIGGVVSTWGSTAAERAQPFPCDAYLPDADQALYRAVDVDAPAPIVFRWLCQLKVAPYSYDWIDNLGRRSPVQLTPGLEQLRVGERVMTMFTLVAFERDRHLTAVLGSSNVFGNLAATYAVRTVDARRSRIVVKLLVRYGRAPLGCVARAFLPTGDLIMMRKQLLTLKHLAERDALRSTVPAV